MQPTPRTPEERYGPALELARTELKGRDPHRIADWANVTYEGQEGGGRFIVPFLGQKYTVSFPSGDTVGPEGKAPPIGEHLIILHYLEEATGVPMADRWIAFRELPGGLGYQSVFDGRVNGRLARIYGQRKDIFKQAALRLGGMPLDVGDVAFAFDALPRVRVAVVIYEGDDEFPTSANFVFDGAAERYLPTEDLIVLGETIASRLKKGI